MRRYIGKWLHGRQSEVQTLGNELVYLTSCWRDQAQQDVQKHETNRSQDKNHDEQDFANS